MIGSVMKKQTNEKRIHKLSQTLSIWGAPLLSLLSYGLVLALAVSGIGLMVISVFVGLFFNSGLLSGFGFLSGGVIFAAGSVLVLWKVTRDLEILCQSLKKSGA